MYINDIIIDGVSLDMSPEEYLDFTAQVNTIAAVASRQASFTPSYRLPKTAKNIRALQGLGLKSDSSVIPYQKPNCALLIEGFTFIVKGWLNVKETTEDYFSIYIYSGVINFFKAIENKNLGDLNLSEIDHIKSLATVVASFTNPNYKYLITDYNGLTHYGANDEIINTDYLIPSVRVKYLWDKIFSTYGFTYEGSVFSIEDFTNLWLTYPKTIAVDDTDVLKEDEGSRYVDRYDSGGIEERYYRALFFPTMDDSRSFTAPAAAKYKITLHVKNSYVFSLAANVVYRMAINQEALPYTDRTNSVILGELPASNTEQTFTLFINLAAGDVISFYDYLKMNGFIRWTSEFNVKIEQVIEGAGDFTEGLKDFSIADFCRDVMTRFCLTLFTDEFSNLIKFKTMRERLVDAPVVNWSKKYVGRKSEEYIYGSYAIRNKFQYQYNDKEATYHDGYISINNVNLDPEKVVFKSKTYSPSKNLTEFKLGGVSKFLRVFKLYDREPKEEDGVTIINYKGLDKRFHFVKKSEFVSPSPVAIGSKTFNEQTSVTYLPIASFDGQDWASMLIKYYPDLAKILNESRLHDIEVDLRDVDLLVLDLGALYYFEQEQQFYILDKLKFKGGKISAGDFIRVKPDAVSSVAPPDPVETTISVVWNDGTSVPKTGYNTTETIKIQGMAYPVNDELLSFEWERYTAGAWTGLGTGVTPHTVPIIAGTQVFRLRAESENSNAFYSNELIFNAPAVLGNCCNYSAVLTGANSGDDLTIIYRDCDGVEQTETVYAGGGIMNETLYLSVCALDGTATLGSRGDLTREDICAGYECHSYRVSKVANTMEDTMNFDYNSCEGHYISQTIYPDFAGQTLEETICARFDTVNSDSGYIDLGAC